MITFRFVMITSFRHRDGWMGGWMDGRCLCRAVTKKNHPASAPRYKTQPRLRHRRRIIGISTTTIVITIVITTIVTSPTTSSCPCGFLCRHRFRFHSAASLSPPSSPPPPSSSSSSSSFGDHPNNHHLSSERPAAGRRTSQWHYYCAIHTLAINMCSRVFLEGEGGAERGREWNRL